MNLDVKVSRVKSLSFLQVRDLDAENTRLKKELSQIEEYIQNRDSYLVAENTRLKKELNEMEEYIQTFSALKIKFDENQLLGETCKYLNGESGNKLDLDFSSLREETLIRTYKIGL
ncbi:42837_t:CDS:2 [Gigaspora margarita]|uniref:42837_t:CDS:1 n=1 Tax=Gigaspora margarita TaxID=4874 RepID=A0ABM8W1F6_GIGMA|nr:42837_t:CDS:2 [Gigaspora margarita]